MENDNPYLREVNKIIDSYKNNRIKKKRKNVEYKLGYIRGSYKKRIEELRNYIKENNITKEEIISAILSI